MENTGLKGESRINVEGKQRLAWIRLGEQLYTISEILGTVAVWKQRMGCIEGGILVANVLL
jgi:hypothetical protein